MAAATTAEAEVTAAAEALPVAEAEAVAVVEEAIGSATGAAAEASPAPEVAQAPPDTSTEPHLSDDSITLQACLAATGEHIALVSVKRSGSVSDLCQSLVLAATEAARLAGGTMAPSLRRTTGFCVLCNGRILPDNLPLTEVPDLFEVGSHGATASTPPVVEFLRRRRTALASASSDGVVKVWCCDTGECATTLEVPTKTLDEKLPLLPPPSTHTPDHGRCLRISGGATVRIIVVSLNQIALTLNGHQANVRHGCFSNDGTLVATASDDGTAKIWNARSGKCLRTLVGHSAEVVFVGFSPDGQKVVSTSADNTARLWTVGMGECVTKFVGHRWPVNSASFSIDGKLIATASDDRTVRIWNAETSTCVRILEGFRGAVTEVCFLE